MKEELRKIIQEAVPEIMELKFGCRVEVKSKRYLKPTFSTEIVICGYEEYENQDDYIIKGFDDEEQLIFGGKKSCVIKQILGRPITLVDVLITLEKKGKDILVDNEGTFCKRDEGVHKTDSGLEDGIYPMGYKQDWNLKENLDNQSKETIEFLYNLLNK